MSWFGLGGGSGGEKKTGSASSTSGSGFDSGGFDDSGTDFAAPRQSFGGGGGGGSLENELMMEQQKALVQAIMFKLTETAFESCVTKPSSSLSSSEQSCITAVVTKYLDASEFVVRKMSQKQ